MCNYTFFTVEQYEKVPVLTWTESAATRVLRNGEMRVELETFVLTARPHCVVVSFAQLTQCPSSLVGGLVGLNRQLKERGSRVMLCAMNPLIREQFGRLHLDRVFEIHGSLSDAVAACQETTTNGGQHDQAKTEN